MLSHPFLYQLEINPYLCYRLGDTPVVPTSCIKGNPVRNRNSARYCKVTLLRLLITQRSMRKTFFKAIPLSYRRLLIANISLSTT